MKRAKPLRLTNAQAFALAKWLEKNLERINDGKLKWSQEDCREVAEKELGFTINIRNFRNVWKTYLPDFKWPSHGQTKYVNRSEQRTRIIVRNLLKCIEAINTLSLEAYEVVGFREKDIERLKAFNRGSEKKYLDSQDTE